MASKRSAKSKSPSKRSRLLTREQLALEMAVTRGTVTRWERDGMPVAKKFSRGRSSLFDLKACEDWRAEKEKPGGLSLEQERAKLAVLQQARAEMDMAMRRGELIKRSEVVHTGRAFAAALAAKIRGLPRMFVTAGLLAASQEPAAAELCRALLKDIASWKVIENQVESAAS